MVCDGPLERREPPAGVTVRFASSAADVAAYANIAGKAFTHLSMPERFTRDAIDNPTVMLGSDCVIALADLDGAPVAGASAMLFGREPAGYVGWVACLDEARGRGLGDVVTRAVTNEAFARGASLLTLEASQFGEHTYARMGYREIYRYRVLIRMES
jgi:GNAT superfamily N-acetyltransferase